MPTRSVFLKLERKMKKKKEDWSSELFFYLCSVLLPWHFFDTVMGV
jgi:hypothetical protein